MLVVYGCLIIGTGFFLLLFKAYDARLTGALLWLSGITLLLANFRANLAEGIGENLLVVLFLFTWLIFLTNGAQKPPDN